MRNLDSCRCWRCKLCPCKVRNKFLINFWNRTILLCIPCTYTSLSVPIRVKNVSDKFYSKSKYILCTITFFRNRAFYESIRKKSVEPDRPHLTIWRMRIAWWKPKATNTHSQYVVLIAFPLQQWLHKRASALRYTYMACLVSCMKTRTTEDIYLKGPF